MGDGDDEHPLARKCLKIQALTTTCVDTSVHSGLLQMHEPSCSWGARARQQELGDAEVDHTWMWRLIPHHGAVMEPEEYGDSVRLRLGCAGPSEPVPCAACQNGSLDTGAAHATCCAVGDATRGAEMEVPGLIPGTDLRPADVLTSALGNSYTALDISICSPHAQQAGADCTQTRQEAKLAHNGPTRQRLR